MRSEKLHLVNYIGGLLKDSDYVYFISYSGLKVADMTVLRCNSRFFGNPLSSVSF